MTKTLNDIITEETKEFEKEYPYTYCAFVNMDNVKSFLAASLSRSIEKAVKECAGEEREHSAHCLASEGHSCDCDMYIHNSARTAFLTKWEEIKNN